MVEREFSTRTALFKWIWYCGLGFLFFLIQSAGFFPAIYGTRPNFLLVWALLAAICEGPFKGAYFGLGCGIFFDIIHMGTAGYFPLTMVIFCFLIGILIRTVMRNNLATALLLVTGAIVLIKFFEWLLFIWLAGVDRTAFSLISRTVPSIIYTAAFIAPLYWLIIWIKTRYDRMSD
jgi:rod shape-determining protein MreD